MGNSESVEAIRSAAKAVNAGDVDGYLRRFAPSCLRWVASVEQPFSLDEVGDNLRQLIAAFAGLRLEEEGLFGTDEFVCAR